MKSDTLSLPHGEVSLPAFFPDGTNGVVRSVDSGDLLDSRVNGLVMNTFHLLNKPGVSTIRSQHGLHAFTGWQRPILTDSGGFQVFSLIRENAKFGTILDDRILFTPEAGGKKTILTPEKCIQAQYAFGSDVMMCLDYCTHPEDSYEVNAKSVDTTIRWAAQCKRAFEKLPQPAEGPKRQLYAIIQGGGYPDLRKACAEALVDMGFAGFGFGGWPMNERGELVFDILAYTAELMPAGSVKYAMGLGKPEEIVALNRAGYILFDCVIPTREARHNRLYAFHEDFASPSDIVPDEGGKFYQYHYILDDKHRRDPRPISAVCDCYCCRNYSRAYLRHLTAMGDALGKRLATCHNLRFFTMLMERLRESGHAA